MIIGGGGGGGIKVIMRVAWEEIPYRNPIEPLSSRVGNARAQRNIPETLEGYYFCLKIDTPPKVKVCLIYLFLEISAYWGQSSARLREMFLE